MSTTVSGTNVTVTDVLIAEGRFTRVFEADLSEGDGRTLELRIVPYNVVATVADPPDFVPYRELFLPGAFDAQMRAANRIWLNFEHEQGLRGIIGTGTELRDGPDGLHGTFRVGSDSDGDKALRYVHEGVLNGVSLEFRARKTQVVDGVRQRVRAIVDRVSLCRSPAYQGAEVLAVRAEPEIMLPAPPAWPDGLLERVAAQGIGTAQRLLDARQPQE